jgi:transketolase
MKAARLDRPDARHPPDLALVHGRPDRERLARAARRLRATCLAMAAGARQGHLASSLSHVDILVALFHGGWLRVTPGAPHDAGRDRFILSKGHGVTALYATFADLGFMPPAWLARYATDDSPTPNHPCRHALPLLEVSSGSLGHGLGIATGMLHGLRLSGSDARAVVLMSDGECNEGSVWEGAMFAAAQRLDRLVAIVDYNGIQAVGRTDTIMGGTALDEKFRAFGWGARTVDGTDPVAVLDALEAVPFVAGRPSAIVARTKIGVSFMEDDVLWHYRVPSALELQRALAELGEPPLQGSRP